MADRRPGGLGEMALYLLFKSAYMCFHGRGEIFITEEELDSVHHQLRGTKEQLVFN